MKIYAFAFFVTLCLACEKTETEPELPLADQVAGDYTFDTVAGDGSSLTLPFVNNENETLTARAVVTKLQDDQVKVVFITKRDNGSVAFSNPEVIEPFILTKESSTISGTANKQKVTFSANRMSLTLTYTSGGVLTYSGDLDQ